MKIIAHRGYSEKAPENTIGSFKLAFDVKSDGIELDIYRIKDEKIVAIHDNSTNRTGDKELTVEDNSLDELKEVDVGSWKGEEWKGEKIPELKEVFDCIPKGKEIVIELKSGYEVISPLKKYILNSNKNKNEITIIAFGEVIFEVKKHFPDIKALALFSEEDNNNIENIIKKVIKGNLDGVDLSWKGLTTEKIKMIKNGGLELYVWTVNDLETARKMKDAGIDGLTTDNPQMMIKDI